MNKLVLDASVAVKWVVEEVGTVAALALRAHFKFLAPELLIVECANVLAKKIKRRELSEKGALLCARLLTVADIEFVSTRILMEKVVRTAVQIDHAAYDCLYLMLAIENDCHFVTADEDFLKKLRNKNSELSKKAVSLEELSKRFI